MLIMKKILIIASILILIAVLIFSFDFDTLGNIVFGIGFGIIALGALVLFGFGIKGFIDDLRK